MYFPILIHRFESEYPSRALSAHQAHEPCDMIHCFVYTSTWKIQFRQKNGEWVSEPATEMKNKPNTFYDVDTDSQNVYFFPCLYTIDALKCSKLSMCGTVKIQCENVNMCMTTHESDIAQHSIVYMKLFFTYSPINF